MRKVKQKTVFSNTSWAQLSSFLFFFLLVPDSNRFDCGSMYATHQSFYKCILNRPPLPCAFTDIFLHQRWLIFDLCIALKRSTRQRTENNPTRFSFPSSFSLFTFYRTLWQLFLIQRALMNPLNVLLTAAMPILFKWLAGNGKSSSVIALFYSFSTFHSTTIFNKPITCISLVFRRLRAPFPTYAWSSRSPPCLRCFLGRQVRLLNFQVIYTQLWNRCLLVRGW